MRARFYVPLILLVVLAACPLLAGEEAAEEEPFLPELDLRLTDPNAELPFAYDPHFGPAPNRYQWSSLLYSFRSGPHAIDVVGGSGNYLDMMAFGDGEPLGAVGASWTYRYYGLFGGIIRPVARVSVGANQYYNSIGLLADGGYAGGWQGYASAEAGLEFVIQGYGVGVTAAYVYSWQMADPALLHSDLEGGPLNAERTGDNFGDWQIHPYLIIDGK